MPPPSNQSAWSSNLLNARKRRWKKDEEDENSNTERNASLDLNLSNVELTEALDRNGDAQITPERRRVSPFVDFDDNLDVESKRNIDLNLTITPETDIPFDTQPSTSSIAESSSLPPRTPHSFERSSSPLYSSSDSVGVFSNETPYVKGIREDLSRERMRLLEVDSILDSISENLDAILSSSNHSVQLNPRTDIDEETLLNRLMERDDEFAVFSDEFFMQRKEIISIRKTSKRKTNENLILRKQIAQITPRAKKYRIIWISELRRRNRSQSRNVVTLPKYTIGWSKLENKSSGKSRIDLALDLLQRISREEDIRNFMIDFQKYLQQNDSQSFQVQLTHWQTIIFQEKCRFSNNQLRRVKQYYKMFTDLEIMPTINLTMQLKTRMSTIDNYKATTYISKGEKVTVVKIIDVEKSVIPKLERFSVSKQLRHDSYTDGKIVIGIGGDSGGGTTKLCLLIGNCDHANSPHRIVLLAVFDDSDSRELIMAYLSDLIVKINNFTSITYMEDGRVVTRGVVQKVVGDFKFTCDLLSHKKQCATYFCPFCFETNPRGGLMQKLKDLNLQKIYFLRTMNSYKLNSKYGSFGVRCGSGPILQNVKLEHYLPAMLHLIVGLFTKYIFEPIWMAVVSLDNKTSFEIRRNKEETKRVADLKIQDANKKFEASPLKRKREMKAQFTALKEEKVLLDETLDGLAGGYLKQFENDLEEVGATRRAWFQMYTGNHTKLILSEKGVTAAFKNLKNHMTPMLLNVKNAMSRLSKIMSLSANRLLSDDDISELDESMKEFVEFLQAAHPEESITQKLHVLVAHVVEVAKTERSWEGFRSKESNRFMPFSIASKDASTRLETQGKDTCTLLRSCHVAI